MATMYMLIKYLSIYLLTINVDSYNGFTRKLILYDVATFINLHKNCMGKMPEWTYMGLYSGLILLPFLQLL